jgi:chromosome segregation ATPase
MEIIAEGAAPHADKAFVQQPTALVQLRSKATQTQNDVASFLAEQGARQGSNLLAALAVRASADPFKKVKKMIKDMVYKLMEEAAEEAEHKGFCDTELGTNKITRDAKTSDAEELSAQIEGLSAEIQKLTTEVADLSDQVVAIDSAVATATTDRAEEKAKNQKTLADAKQALTAVESAMAVLKQFYDKAAQATALPQQGSIDYDDRALTILNRQGGASLLQTRGPADEAPGTFSKPFKGSGGEGGILGMLEVILSDFQRLEAETNENEHAAKEEYDAFAADSAEDKAVKNADIKFKTKKKTMSESDLATAKKDLKSTQEELNAALEYYEKLKPSCVDAGESYEERVARRKAEIESLQEALKILAP